MAKLTWRQDMQQHRCCTRCGEPLLPHEVGYECAPCCAKKHEYYLRVELPKRWQQRMQGPNLIAHCGRWHRIETLPWLCPQCGKVVGAQQGG